jgi:small subunit ribosomal protein S1
MSDRIPDEASVLDDTHEIEASQEDFASLLQDSEFAIEARIDRDAKVQGTVVSLGQEWVFLDIGAKSEGHIAREELLDDERNLTVRVGDRVTAYVVAVRPGDILLSVKMTTAASEEAIRGAFRSGVPVEGLVQGERKGGYTVTVFGKPAFCPYSQIDLPPAGPPEQYVDQRLTFRITEYSERGRNIVLSRRDILEEERLKRREELKKTLRTGDVVRGMVQKLAPFGAFVDLGGVEGLIPMSELAWYRVAEAADVVSPGQEVSVRILDIDWSKDRVSLSLRQTQENPWESVAQRFVAESKVTGTVTKLMQYGAFVELEPGVEGLIHVSNLGTGRRISHPKEVLSEGDVVEVRVLSIDPAGRRIGLELSLTGKAGTEGSIELREGDVVVGTVDSVKDYGVFLSLPGGRSGLLHVSEIADSESGGDLRRRFAPGSTVEVVVSAMDPESKKVSLSTKRLSKRIEESQFRAYADEATSRGSFGTLGDLLKDKLKK